MTLLRNPLYLGFMFLGFLLIKALWVQLDVSGEFRNGALPGFISISSKIVPTIMNLLMKLAEEGQAPVTNNPHRNTIAESRIHPNRVDTPSGMSSMGSSERTSENRTEYTSTSKED
ncbi:hypothetical protein MLD38_007157 [Melastoma candidum]|uniref:Uncharacterized protein n=1 Tax=Melastoma candidum TaxID=119954 RepID=A0ACB9RQ60_9MYRT|nr:hypothetical protein MLD38_007157 [Melastoma candidum]